MRLDGLSLYEYMACPFCRRVRDAIDRLGLEIERRNIQQEREHFEALVGATGRATVPCLRIEDGDDVQWMHESLDIIAYLERRVAEAAGDPCAPSGSA